MTSVKVRAKSEKKVGFWKKVGFECFSKPRNSIKIPVFECVFIAFQFSLLASLVFIVIYQLLRVDPNSTLLWRINFVKHINKYFYSTSACTMDSLPCARGAHGMRQWVYHLIQTCLHHMIFLNKNIFCHKNFENPTFFLKNVENRPFFCWPCQNKSASDAKRFFNCVRPYQSY